MWLTLEPRSITFSFQPKLFPRNSWPLIGQKKGRTSFWLDLNRLLILIFISQVRVLSARAPTTPACAAFCPASSTGPWYANIGYARTHLSQHLHILKKNLNFAERAVFIADRGPQTYQGSTNCSILPSRMGKHGVSWENMDNMEKMENINQIPKTLYVRFKTL